MSKFNGLAAGFAVCCLLFILLMRTASGQPCDKPTSVRAAYSYHDYNKMIVAALRRSQAQVADFNGDDKINCIDYSCSFKAAWDRMYPDQKERCRLARNKNPVNGMHHLFALVNGGGSAEFEVETWAANPILYSMRSNWSEEEYNPVYNIYGETDIWMRECGLR